MPDKTTLELLQTIAELSANQRSSSLDKVLQPRSRISYDAKANGSRTHGLAGWHELNPDAGPMVPIRSTEHQIWDLRKKWIAEEQAKKAAEANPQSAAAPKGEGGLMGFVKNLFSPQGTPASGQAPAPASAQAASVANDPTILASQNTWGQANQGIVSQQVDPLQQPVAVAQPPAAQTAQAVAGQQTAQPASGLSYTPVADQQGFHQGPPVWQPIPTLTSKRSNTVLESEFNPPAPAAPSPPDLSQIDGSQWEARDPNLPSLAPSAAGLANLIPQGVQKLGDYMGNVAQHAKTAYNTAGDATISAFQKAQGMSVGDDAAMQLERAMARPGYTSALANQATAAKTAATAERFAKPFTGLANLAGEGSLLGKITGVASKAATPIQTAMMLVEGGRLATDKNFRDAASHDYEGLTEKGPMGRTLQGVAAPISTLTNMALKTPTPGSAGREELARWQSNVSSQQQLSNVAAIQRYREDLKAQGLSEKEIRSKVLNRTKTQNRK